MPQETLNNLFIQAVRTNNLEEVKKLIKTGADVTTTISYVLTSGDWDHEVITSTLMYAARRNFDDLLKLLLESKNKFQDFDAEISTVLNEAIEQRHSEIVKLVIESGINIDYVDKWGNTPLETAIDCSYANFKSDPGLHYKARESEAIINMILDAGANINHVNKYGQTPLMIAIKKSDFDTFQKLLNKPNINLNHVDYNGNTAMIIAIKNIHTTYANSYDYNLCVNSQNIATKLLSMPGINIDHVNKEGETARKLFDKKIKRY